MPTHVPFYMTFVDGEIEPNPGELRSWNWGDWGNGRLYLLAREYSTIVNSTNQGHPWSGRAQRNIAQRIQRTEELLGLVAPRVEGKTVDLTLDWVRSCLDVAIKQAQRFKGVARVLIEENKVNKHTVSQIAQTFVDQFSGYANILEQKWMPPTTLSQPYVDSLERMVLIVFSGPFTPNRSMQATAKKAIRTRLWRVQRDAFEASREHGLEWRVEDWDHWRKIPVTDGISWAVGTDQVGWPNGASPLAIYETICRTTFGDLVETRRRELAELIQRMEGKHWTQLRALVQKEASGWGNSIKGLAYFQNLPAMTDDELRIHMDLIWANVSPLLRNRHLSLDERSKISKWCQSLDLSEHRWCSGSRNEKKALRCYCTCHLENQMTAEERRALIQRDNAVWYEDDDPIIEEES